MMAFRDEVTSRWKRLRAPVAPAPAKPSLGMTLAFKPSVSPELTGIPGQVIDIWPCLHSGDYLVMLEYARPVRYEQEVIRQIAAFMSELEPVGVAKDARVEPTSWYHRFWGMLH